MSYLNNALDRDLSVLKVDLSKIDENTKHMVEGKYLFYAKGISDIGIKFNSPSNDEIIIPKGGDIRLPNGFNNLYINSAGTDIIDLYIFAEVNSKVEIPTPNANNSNISDFNKAFTVGTTASIISHAVSSLKEAIIYNNSNQNIYIGDSGVTHLNGLPIPPNSSFGFNSFIGDLYAITEAGDSDVRVARVL